MMQASTKQLPWILLALASFSVTLCFYPWNADACFSVNDALWYAHSAENDGLASIYGHHPLFHLLLLPITAAVDFAGVPHAGHVAIRVVAGGGLAAIIMLCGALAGWRRRALPLLLLLLASRCIFVESAVGECLALSAASILLAFKYALDPSVSWLRVAAATVLALLVRQDAVLIVPGLLVALHLRTPPQERSFGRLARWLVGTGIVTLALYALLWKLSQVPDFLQFLLSITEVQDRTWAQPTMPGLSELSMRIAMLGVAAAGAHNHHYALALNAGIGCAWIAALWLTSRLCGASATPAPLRWGLLTILGARFGFYTWFEAHNHEWWFVDLVLLTATCASSLRTPRHGVRPAAVLVVALGVAGLLYAHGPSTWLQRRTTLADAAAVAAEWSHDPMQPVVLSYGYRPHAALHLLAIPHNPQILAEPPKPEEAGRRLRDALMSTTKPIVVLIDRFAGDGQPYQYQFTEDYLTTWVDLVPPIPPSRAWKQLGKTQVLWLQKPN
jgi:hypothetical protein